MKPNEVGISLQNAYAYVLLWVPKPQLLLTRTRELTTRGPPKRQPQVDVGVSEN